MERKEPRASYLIALVGGRRLALPLPDVVEVMRPLPVSKLAGAPASVLGTAVVRGVPVPVVDAGELLGETGPRTCTRFVSLRLGARGAALAVDALAGVQPLDESELSRIAPPLRETVAGDAEASASHREEVLLVLRAGRLVRERARQAPGASET
jgi:purine-binding chemotaxis protein CheW